MRELIYSWKMYLSDVKSSKMADVPRIFRPWDGQDSTVTSSMTPTRNTQSPAYSVPSPSPMHEHSLRINEWSYADDQSRLSGADSRASSCTADSSENEEEIKIRTEVKRGYNIKAAHAVPVVPSMPPQPTMMSSVDRAQLFHFQQLQQQAFYYGLPAISPFFGLDAIGNPMMSPMGGGGGPAALSAANMANSNVAMMASRMDPMAMSSAIDPMYMGGAVGHEYARVLAEEAQAKLMSARKQRPKKFKCTYCDVAFSNNGQLKGHVRIHTGKSAQQQFK